MRKSENFVAKKSRFFENSQVSARTIWYGVEEILWIMGKESIFRNIMRKSFMNGFLGN